MYKKVVKISNEISKGEEFDTNIINFPLTPGCKEQCLQKTVSDSKTVGYMRRMRCNSNIGPPFKDNKNEIRA
jgi:5,10-methylene-tetrahydrofolate dehydrogenase/methenyl tetrahydrofolate cyclohydrolase